MPASSQRYGEDPRVQPLERALVANQMFDVEHLNLVEKRSRDNELAMRDELKTERALMRDSSHHPGLRVAAWRALRGRLSQVTAAEMLGVHQSTLSRIERGDLNPGRAQALEIQTHTGVPAQHWDVRRRTSDQMEKSHDEEEAVR